MCGCDGACAVLHGSHVDLGDDLGRYFVELAARLLAEIGGVRLAGQRLQRHGVERHVVDRLEADRVVVRTRESPVPHPRIFGDLLRDLNRGLDENHLLLNVQTQDAGDPLGSWWCLNTWKTREKDAQPTIVPQPQLRN